MINHMFCPIISYQKQYQTGTECMEEACALWDKERGQCSIKTMALAAAGKTSGGSSPTAQPYYISPSSYCQTNAVSDKIIDDSYQLTRDISIAPVLRERGY